MTVDADPFYDVGLTGGNGLLLSVKVFKHFNIVRVEYEPRKIGGMVCP